MPRERCLAFLQGHHLSVDFDVSRHLRGISYVPEESARTGTIGKSTGKRGLERSVWRKREEHEEPREAERHSQREE